MSHPFNSEELVRAFIKWGGWSIAAVGSKMFRASGRVLFYEVWKIGSSGLFIVKTEHCSDAQIKFVVGKFQEKNLDVQVVTLEDLMQYAEEKDPILFSVLDGYLRVAAERCEAEMTGEDGDEGE